ncbi:tetratricopeptide repeat protein [Thermaurantimonas aggregans]|uniref:tetratricopeptide repeat protein n=1 Tax=Thermaurantimonas aggregans TaxID=2173829 RepID=UPI0013572EFB|nr:tetratricopeptide repeat protein [Thermaurantimonas aggregans]MCX8149199.1 tetratricopeptide repeat protein [Thermaurantimonas aggregans]
MVPVLIGLSTKVQAQIITQLHQAGKYDQVLLFGNKVDSLRGDEALLVADAFFRKKNPQKAEEILTKIIKRGYTTEEAYWQLTQVLLAQEKWVLALENIEKALKFNTSNFVYLKIRAGILLQLGKNREAEAEYRKLLRLRPNDESLYWLTYQAIAEQEDYRRGKSFLISNIAKFKTAEYQNRVYDALVRTYHYTLGKPDSALYYTKKWQNSTGKNNQNVSLELLLLNALEKFDESIQFANTHKKYFKETADGILWDEIRGQKEYAIQVYYHPSRKYYTMYLMDAEQQYIQGKMFWKKLSETQSEVKIETARRTDTKTFSIPITDYAALKKQSTRIARALNNLE